MKEVIHNYVQNLRKKRGITQESLAKELNVSRQTIVAIEKGNYMPSLILGLKIAKFFKTTIENVFTYSYEK